MKMKLLNTAILSSLLGLSMSSQADTIDRSGFYLGAKSGWVDFNHCADNSCDDDAWAGSALAGYQFNNWLSYELGYNYLGKSHGQTEVSGMPQDTTTAQNIEMSLKTDWYLTNDFNLFAKAGGAFNNIESEVADVSRRDYDTSLMLGGGFEYSLTNNFRFRTEYQWFKDAGSNSVGKIEDLQYVSMGFIYKFGQNKSNLVEASALEAAEGRARESEAMRQAAEAERQAAEARAQEAEKKLAEYQPDIVYNSNSFAVNSKEMTSEAKTQTKETLKALQDDLALSARIVGHTDSTGSETYNQKLSQERANTVADYLESQGISSSRISTQGLGESNPIATNATAEGRSQNRRVEVFLIK